MLDNPPSPQHPFSLQNRLLRLLWQVVAYLFFHPSPRPCHAWRAWLLRCFGAKLGKDCHIYPKVQIWAPWKLHCEDAVGIGEGAVVYNQAAIYVGQGAVVSQEAFLCTGTHDYQDPSFPLVAKPICIGPKAWIAARAFIHPGCSVGEGAVVGACSVVTKDVPPWAIVAGNPTRVIGQRSL
jgi:putative colanic acid biosynthesis acetyltransferase WcaF